jgi:thiamine biosynthesis lipoprotein
MQVDNAGVQVHRFFHDAMATFNHIDISHDHEHYARQAAQAAFQEMDQLIGSLSRFEEGSDIWQLNCAGAGVPVLLARETYECLKLAKQMSHLTRHAFDITIGPVFACWADGDDDLESARKRSGIDLLNLCDDELSAQLSVDGMKIDLGGIGKGYIVDKMAEVLEEWEVPRSLINSGGSSILALDPPLGAEGWSVTCGDRSFRVTQTAVSSSGMAVKGNHIMDPRTGLPVADDGRYWCMAPTAAIADALSTAAIVMNSEEIGALCEQCPEIKLFCE